MLVWLRKTTHTNCGHLDVAEKDNTQIVVMLVWLRKTTHTQIAVMLWWLTKTTLTNCGHLGVVQKDNTHKLWSCWCGAERQCTQTVVIHINVGVIAVMFMWLRKTTHTNCGHPY